jgi:putative sporulation protein YyaC
MFSKKNRVHIDDKNASLLLQRLISKQILKLKQKNSDIIILCVGTDRSTGDCLGPLTGSYLKKFKNLSLNTIGDINNPVHASNLDNIIKKINDEYTSPFIIAIDAGLGKKSSVGYVDVKKGPLKPGTGVNKELTKIGDMHITGLVNVGGYMEYLVLQSTRLSIVMKMANVIAQGIKKSILTIYQEKSVVE